jgi:subtilisin family serine protease
MPVATAGTGTTAGDNLNGISEPSCSDDVISVAAYAPQYTTSGGSTTGGAIASFSSIGPRYDGAMKPDIAAPGVSIASSISSFTNSTYTSVASVPFNNRTYHFAKFSGTSMASPMVAGVVALILDANPYLMPQQVKDIIMQTAREDNYTQVIPAEGSPKWGAGKINAYAAVQLALITVGTKEIQQEKQVDIYPNPTSSELNFKGDFIPTSIELIDLNGHVLKKEVQNEKVIISELMTGTYFVRFLKDGKVYQEKITKL